MLIRAVIKRITLIQENIQMQSKRIYVCLILFICYGIEGIGQSVLNKVNIGNLHTTSGQVINDCIVGYRTSGRLDISRNNAVLCPLWFQGTSADNAYFNEIIDTAGLFLIYTDPLGNGVSSSPSNCDDFPEISIRDMVNAQHKLLVNHLKINHLKLIIGISMGGMQAFEWVVTYPDFADKAISLNGSPKISFYDKLVWQTKIKLLEDAASNENDLKNAMNRVAEIAFMTDWTPQYLSGRYDAELLEKQLKKRYLSFSEPLNYLCQSIAILNNNIYRSTDDYRENIQDIIRTDMMILVSIEDHAVDPSSSIALANDLNCNLHKLDSDCGHFAVFCETKEVRQAISKFLKM